MLLSLLGKSLAAKAVFGVATVSLSGVTVAAATGSLPAPAQQVAYDVAGEIGVPAPSDAAPSSSAPEPRPSVSRSKRAAGEPRPSLSSSPSPLRSPKASEDVEQGPDASGPAGRGLCEAYRNGAVKAGSVKEQALVRAAGSIDGIGAFCDTVLAGHDDRRPPRSPEPSKTAEASQKPERSPKAEPSSKPEQSSKPERSERPEASRTPEPSKKAEPSRKPEPSKKAEPSKKPEPSREPRASASPRL